MTQYFSKALYIFLIAMVGVACGLPPNQNNNNQQNNNTVNNNNQQNKVGTVKIWLKEGQAVSSSKLCFFPYEGMMSTEHFDNRDALWRALDNFKKGMAFKEGKVKLECVIALSGSSNAISSSLPVGDYFIFDDTGRYISRYVTYVYPEKRKSTFGKITVTKGEVVEYEIDHGLIIITNGDLNPSEDWWCSYYDSQKNWYLDDEGGVFAVALNEDGIREYVVYLVRKRFFVGDGNTFRPYKLDEGVVSYKGSFDKVGDKEWAFVGTYRYKDDKPEKPDQREEYRCQPLSEAKKRWN